MFGTTCNSAPSISKTQYCRRAARDVSSTVGKKRRSPDWCVPLERGRSRSRVLDVWFPPPAGRNRCKNYVAAVRQEPDPVVVDDRTVFQQLRFAVGAGRQKHQPLGSSPVVDDHPLAVRRKRGGLTLPQSHGRRSIHPAEVCRPGLSTACADLAQQQQSPICREIDGDRPVEPAEVPFRRLPHRRTDGVSARVVLCHEDAAVRRDVVEFPLTGGLGHPPLRARSGHGVKLGLPVARHAEKYFAPRWRPRQARDAGEAACERLAFPETRHDLHRLIASAELQEGDGVSRPGDTRLLDKPFHLVDGVSSDGRTGSVWS